MSASDLRDDIKKEKKTAGEWFLLFLASPLMAYYFVLDLIDYLVEMNHKYADKLFLKRIRMTQVEFDQFMHWRIHVQDVPAKLRPQPSYDDDDDCCEDWFEDGPDGVVERPRDIHPSPPLTSDERIKLLELALKENDKE
jgi:hypothetical protein